MTSDEMLEILKRRCKQPENGWTLSDIFDAYKVAEEIIEEEERRQKKIKAGATNGEMFRDTFPEYQIEKVFNSVIVWINHDIVTFSEKWWNAPYNG